MMNSILAIGALLPILPIPIHDAHRPQALHAHSLEKACTMAVEHHRMVLGYVSADPTKGMPLFRWPDPASRQALDPVLRETVLAELHQASAPAGLSTWFLMEPTGEVVWQSQADWQPATLSLELEPWLLGNEALRRVGQAMETKQPAEIPYFWKERWMHLLFHHGRVLEGALRLEECLKASLTDRDPEALGRRTAVLVQAAHWAKQHPEVLELANRWRREIERMLKNPRTGQPRLATDLAQMNAAWGQPERNLALFFQLESGHPVRRGLLDAVFMDLIRLQEYAAVLELVDPLQALRGELQVARRMRVSRPGYARHARGRGSFSFALRRGLGLLEAAAARRHADCLPMLQELRATAQSALTSDQRAQLAIQMQEAVDRAGRTDLRSHIPSDWTPPRDAQGTHQKSDQGKQANQEEVR